MSKRGVSFRLVAKLEFAVAIVVARKEVVGKSIDVVILVVNVNHLLADIDINCFFRVLASGEAGRQRYGVGKGLIRSFAWFKKLCRGVAWGKEAVRGCGVMFCRRGNL